MIYGGPPRTTRSRQMRGFYDKVLRFGDLWRASENSTHMYLSFTFVGSWWSIHSQTSNKNQHFSFVFVDCCWSIASPNSRNTSRSFLEVAAQVWTPRAQIIQHLSFIFVGYCEGIQYQKSKKRAPLVYFRRLLSLITSNMSTPLVHFRRLLLKRKLWELEDDNTSRSFS